MFKEWITTMFESKFCKNFETSKYTNISDDVSNITKKCIEDYNTLTPKEFFNKFACSKVTYLRRLKQYGDPYMNSPLAKFAKRL